MAYVVPDKCLTWQGIYDYHINSIGLVENDKNPGTATDLRELFVQKVTDVAKVETKQHHVGGGLFDSRLELGRADQR